MQNCNIEDKFSNSHTKSYIESHVVTVFDDQISAKYISSIADTKCYLRPK